MSGYLHGLVARASGAPIPDASSARPRRSLRFPIGAVAGDPTAADAERRDARVGRAPNPPATPLPRPERSDDRSPVVGESAAALMAGDRPAPAAPMSAAHPTTVAPAITTVTTAQPPASAPAHADGSAPPRVRTRPHDVLPDERHPELALPPPAAIRLRPAPAPGPATPTTPPRIEVHIGRVEVRRPATPVPTGRAERHAGPSRPAPRGFGELAAARRYVDRLAR